MTTEYIDSTILESDSFWDVFNELNSFRGYVPRFKDNNGNYHFEVPNFDAIENADRRARLRECCGHFLYPEFRFGVQDGQAIINHLCRQLERNSRKRKTARKKVEGIFDDAYSYGYPVYFVTLTFTDEVLASTSDETRRRYVTRALKLVSSRYMANIDFGKQNGREHYHAVFLSDKNASIEDIWKCGYVNVKVVRLPNEDDTDDRTALKLSKYTAKISNHSVKNTTKNSRLITSRKTT